ncbi:MAG: 4Fe-4S dicluster domain-containing protein [Rhodocyclaceae bacterium]|nr:4Fe-4S dicluster domain-containing protein [Rhodocyclaceae bacterium]
MGHLVGKDIFRELGAKIDGMEMRAPWNDRLRAVLEELYTREEADVVVKMPYGLSTFQQLATATGYEETQLRRILDSLTAKGLAIDLWINEAYHYTPSPLIVGIFEFTMMRMAPDADTKKWAKLLHDYMEGDDAFLEGNLGKGEKFAFMRALPHESAIAPSEYFEVLDYEKASALIAEADKFAIGICSCRHEKMHLGEKKCDVPLESCTQFGYAADFMIRHKMAREVSRSEMEEHFIKSKERGLVLAADNVQKNMRFVCHCCKCCCGPMLAIREHGYPNALLTSNFIAGIQEETCVGCGMCAKACPINAIAMIPLEKPASKKRQDARVDTSLCVGCGVCALKCPTKACRLTKRGQRVIYPETTFERIMLQSLEKGTLQNQIFANPRTINEKFMRAFVGAFLRFPTVKKALLSDRLRSRFLAAMKQGVAKQGKEWVTEM